MAVANAGSPTKDVAAGYPDTTSLTVPSGTTLLVVALCIRGTATVSSATFDGVNMRTNAALRTAAAQACEIIYLENPSIGTFNFTFSLSAGNAAGMFFHYLSGTATTGVFADTFGSVATSNSSTGNTATPTATLSNLDAGSMAISGVVHEGSNAMSSAGTNQTMQTTDHGQWNSAASYEAFASSSSSDAQSFTNGASDTYAMVAAEVLPAVTALVETRKSVRAMTAAVSRGANW